MKGYEKYTQPYFMPPEVTYDWARKTEITKPPIWCSVDLRDGNQALIEPMSLQEKLDYFEHWRWDVYPVVNHEIKDGKIVAKSAFWGTDTYDAATSKIFESEKEAKKYKHRQNALEVLFNEPENRESWTWKEEFEKWLPDMLPLWR